MRVVRHLVRLAGDYRVVLLVLAVCAVATRVARWSLGPDPSRADVEELGYGLPAVEDGRLWTLLTGMVLTWSLGVLLVCALLYPVENVHIERIQGYADAID